MVPGPPAVQRREGEQGREGGSEEGKWEERRKRTSERTHVSELAGAVEHALVVGHVGSREPSAHLALS
jgi:hypothetical protein